MQKFKDLGLSEETLEILEKQNIVEPTEIQLKAIPFALEGRDVVATSATGSGKTLAFASAIVEKIIPDGNVQSIILTPTRELAEQVNDAIKSFAGDRLKVTSVYGGVDIRTQMRRMHGSDVIVGTPGRVLDHLSRRSLNLTHIKVLVLDEFDRMLDMGFHRDVEKIIREMPTDRQTLLFSATISGVQNLVDRYTNNAAEITAKTFVDHSKLKQIYYDTPANQKFALLVHLLKEEQKSGSGLVMVFCSTRRNTDFVAGNLNLNDIDAKAIHGGLEQKKRMRVLQEFHSDSGVGVIVCTDVAARGLDIKGVTHIYNYDLPQLADDYIHRIGRTARAGEKGIAINILSSRDYEIFSDITNKKKMKIEEVPLPQTDRVIMDKNVGSRTRSRADSRGGSRGRDSSRGRSSYGGRSDGRSTRPRVEMHDAVCKKCGRACKVPFKPTTGVGVSCSDCFIPKGGRSRPGESSGGRRSFSENRSRDFSRSAPRNDYAERRNSRGSSSRDSSRSGSYGGRSQGSSYSRDSGSSYSNRSSDSRGRSSYGGRSQGSSYSRDSGRSSGFTRRTDSRNSGRSDSPRGSRRDSNYSGGRSSGYSSRPSSSQGNSRDSNRRSSYSGGRDSGRSSGSSYSSRDSGRSSGSSYSSRGSSGPRSRSSTGGRPVRNRY